MSRIESLQQEILGLAPEEREALTRWLAEQSPTKATECPKTLYRYMDAKGIAGLENDELMFSSPTDTNDPFEFLTSLGSLLMPNSVGAERTYHAEVLQRRVGREWFLLFLSEQPHNPRMWAQYGGGHTGLMLEMDTQAGMLKELHVGRRFLRVEYHKQDRVDLPTLEKQHGSLETDHIRQIVSQKGPDWSHEREWRVLLNKPELDNSAKPEAKLPGVIRLLEDKMKAFLPIEPECITKVVLGYRSSPQLLNTVLQIKAAKNAPWQVARAILSLDSHSFDEELIET